MKREDFNSRQFTVQFVFVMLLFLTIVIMSVMIIILGKNVYLSINEDRSDSYQTRVSLSYVANKIRQSDADGAVDIKDLNGNPAIVLNETYDGSEYETWIYHYDDYLWEFFGDKGMEFNESDGMKVLEVENFNIEKVSDGLFKMSVTDGFKGVNTELVLSVYSER